MKKGFVFPFLLLFWAVVALSGCGAGGIAKSGKIHAVEGLDPFAYGDEFALRPSGTAGKPAQSLAPGAEKSAPEAGRKAVNRAAPLEAKSDTAAVPASAEVKSQPSGTVYRAQIGIYEERKSAEKRAGEARSKVSETVYIEFEPPFYRVRVGDFKTREEAEKYVKTLQDYGFRGSFWVMKNLNTP
jgi:hypothetical protein